MSSKGLASGLIWTLVTRFGAQATQLIFSLFLARLLTPEQFGQAGILIAILGGLQIVCEVGLANAVIYFAVDDRERLSSVYWFQVVLCAVAVAALTVSAGWLARFFDTPVLADIAWLMALGMPFQILSQTLSSVLARRGQYREMGLCNYIGVLVGSVVALLMARAGQGVWALAWMSFVTSAATWLSMHLATRFLPMLRFRWGEIAEFGRYGGPLVIHNTLNYWMRNGDNLVIGRFLGAVPLGIYNRAYTLMLLPLQNIGAVLGPVMFPALTRLKTDMTEFAGLYSLCVQRIAFITFPLMAGMSVLAEPFIVLMYGPQWVASAPILALLSLVGMFQSIIFPVGWVFTALGKTHEQSRLSMLLFPLFFAAIGVGLWLGGLLGVAAGYAAWALLSGFLNVKAVSGFMGLTAAHYLSLILRKLWATLAMAAVLLVLLPQVSSLGNGLQLAVCIPVGALAYLAWLGVTRDPELGWALQMMRRRRAGGSK